jgi:hypothetical protein
MFDDHLFGLSVSDIRKLAYQFAVRKKNPHHFSHKNQMAGDKWFRGFLSRPAGQTLSIRKPENLSMNRFQSFTKENCDSFFGILEKLVDTR